MVAVAMLVVKVEMLLKATGSTPEHIVAAFPI